MSNIDPKKLEQWSSILSASKIDPELYTRYNVKRGLRTPMAVASLSDSPESVMCMDTSLMKARHRRWKAACGIAVSM